MNKVMTSRRGMSVIEISLVLAILSLLSLPGVMVFTEYSRGGSDVSYRYEILKNIESRLENALAMSFEDIPTGMSSNIVIESANGIKLDLKPVIVCNKQIVFECESEVFPVDFGALKDYESRQLHKSRVDEGIKSIKISARWGVGEQSQKMELMAYKSKE